MRTVDVDPMHKKLKRKYIGQTRIFLLLYLKLFIISTTKKENYDL